MRRPTVIKCSPPQCWNRSDASGEDATATVPVWIGGCRSARRVVCACADPDEWGLELRHVRWHRRVRRNDVVRRRRLLLLRGAFYLRKLYPPLSGLPLPLLPWPQRQWRIVRCQRQSTCSVELIGDCLGTRAGNSLGFEEIFNRFKKRFFKVLKVC